MKFVTYQEHGMARHGVWLNNGNILDLAAGFTLWEKIVGRPWDPATINARYGADLLGLIERQDVAMPVVHALCEEAELGEIGRGQEGWPLLRPGADVTLLSPIPRPPSMRDGYAFRQHVMTARRNRGLEMIPEFDQFPVFYFTNHLGVIGPGRLEVQKLHLDRLDFELEVAIVVGSGGRNIKAKDADAHIFGYLIMNDFSARALQMEEMKLNLGPAKGKDFATALGPWLVTPDELAGSRLSSNVGDRYNLSMRAWVNGVQVSEGNTAQMDWTFAQLLERASYGVSLIPGEVIGSGTVGTGCFLELNGSKITNNQWLNPGDTVALEIEGLGRLEHKVFLVEEN